MLELIQLNDQTSGKIIDELQLIFSAKHLNVRNFHFLGRVNNLKSVVKDSMLQSKQMGKREMKAINTEGRVQFDLLLILVRDYKLRSYTLNAVSYHFLQVFVLNN